MNSGKFPVERRSGSGGENVVRGEEESMQEESVWKRALPRKREFKMKKADGAAYKLKLVENQYCLLRMEQ